MLDFVRWRGDLTYRISPPSELDFLIYTQFSYLHYWDVLGENEDSFASAAEKLEKIAHEPGNAQIVADRHRLLKLAANSVRFGELRVRDAADRFDPEREMQFAAVTFMLPDGSPVLAFRGTDATIVGWREDCNMAVACPIPAQTEAVGYLEKVASENAGTIYLCGHSKGGNLATYAASMAKPETRARIAEIVTFDSPGFDDGTLQSAGYREILPRVRSFVPQTSIVGMLMGVPEQYTVVKSDAFAAFQHNTFTWKLDGPHFETLPSVDNTSRVIKAALDEFLRSSTPEMRGILVDTLFEILSAPNARTINDMKANWTGTAAAIWNATRSIDPSTRKVVMSIVGSLASDGLESAKRLAPELEKKKPKEE